MPADIRPLVVLDNGNFATADVNDLYRRLINLANRLAKLEELRAPWVIIWNERRELQRAADALCANCLEPKQRAVFGDSNRPLVDCLELLVRRLLDDKSKRVEWCARARALALAGLSERRLKVPHATYAELQLDANQPVLVTSEDGEGAFVALLPEPHEHAVFAMAPAVYERLGLNGIEHPSCDLHRPLGVEACAEARRLLEGDPGASVAVDAGTSWIDVTEREALISRMIEAAMNETRVLLGSPHGMLIGGTGSVDLVPDSELPTELGPIDPDELRMACDKECAARPSAEEEIKVGGWPAWIQSPESYAPLVAQIASNDDAEMCFGDWGSLYIFAREDGGYHVVFQQY
jgi:hypothetical protein